MDTLEDYNRRSDKFPSRRGIMRELIGSIFVAAVGFAFCAALAGCYGSPIDTRAIDADKVTITHATPWTTLTIQAEGWHSTVKTLDGRDMGNATPLRRTTGQGEAAAVQTSSLSNDRQMTQPVENQQVGAADSGLKTEPIK